MTHPWLEAICFFLALLFGLPAAARTWKDQPVPAGNFLVIAAAITGFTFLHWFLR